MTTANYRLQTALDYLNTLIDQGWEFPEAVDTAIFGSVSHRCNTKQGLTLADRVAYSSSNRCKTLEALAVNRDELVSAYDSQD